MAGFTVGSLVRNGARDGIREMGRIVISDKLVDRGWKNGRG